MRPILCTIAPGVHRLAITTPPASRSSRPLQTPPRGNMTCTRDKTRLLLAAAMSEQDILYGLSRARAEPTSAPVLHLPPHRHAVSRSRKECLQLRRQVATGSRQAAVSRCNPGTCSSRSPLESAGDQMHGRERRRRDRRLLSALRLNLDGPDPASCGCTRTSAVRRPNERQVLDKRIGSVRSATLCCHSTSDIDPQRAVIRRGGILVHTSVLCHALILSDSPLWSPVMHVAHQCFRILHFLLTH
jgi:hypothetical protein